MGTAFEGPGIVNFDMSPRSFTVILLITFAFQHFLTKVLDGNPYIIELIPLEFLVLNKIKIALRQYECKDSSNVLVLAETDLLLL